MVESTLTSQRINPAASALACNNVSSRATHPDAAISGTVHTPSATVLTRTAGPATELRSEPATAHRLPAADSQATCDLCPPQAATTPAPTTAHQKDPLAPHLDQQHAGRAQEAENTAHRRARARVEHTFTRMKSWKILRDCRLKGNGVHQAMLGIARLHNLTLAG